MPKILIGEKKDDHHSSEKEKVFCYCRKGEFGKMVECDGHSCAIGWYHFSCVNLEREPKGAWFCQDCL